MNRKLLYALLAVAAVIVVAIAAVLILQDSPEPESPLVAPGPTVTQPPQTALSPVDTVLAYLDRWNARDSAGMRSYLIEADQDHDQADFEYTAAIEVTNCVEHSREEAVTRFEKGFEQNFFPSTYDVALVVADYSIIYNDAGKDFYQTGSAQRDGYSFWLIKETEDGDWRIAMQGY